MVTLRSAIVGAVLSATSFVAAWDNNTVPTTFYYSRPDIVPPILTVERSNDTYVHPGLVFITPYQQPQAGPYIYDKAGNLVWDGYAEIGPFNAHNFYPCQWNNSQHLCMFQGNQLFGYARGHGIILNQDYKIVKTIESVGDVPPLDQHEFRMINNGESALITIYQQVPYDLSRIDITEDIGWVTNSIFQEINTTDNSLIFEWRSLDHVEPWDTYVPPKSSDISGSGKKPQSPWDYFHINSVDKSKAGHYLISARHMGKLYYINGTSGDIIWTLEAGGKSDFRCVDFKFAFQHDAEIHHEDDKRMNISIYDNASNNANKTDKRSAGKFITIDFEKKEARLYRPSAYHHDGLLSASQGNTQMLPNGNVFQAFGSWPRFAESDPDGNVVWAGRIGPKQGHNMVYRAYSSAWSSVPSQSKPSVWVYSRRSDAPIVFYVSWNGCTQIQTWNFYGANDMNDQFQLIGTTNKMGFETRFKAEMHFKYTYAEAVSFEGKSLRNSSITATWVPSPDLAVACNEFNCKGENNQ